jgi:hypothetical protein
MYEFASIERCAAFVATRDTLVVMRRATTGWPDELAEPARRVALATVVATAEALDYAPSTAARRRCVRDALVHAIELASAFDIARALGCAADDLAEAERLTGRAIALLAMFLHASAPAIAED